MSPDNNSDNLNPHESQDGTKAASDSNGAERPTDKNSHDALTLDFHDHPTVEMPPSGTSIDSETVTIPGLKSSQPGSAGSGQGPLIAALKKEISSGSNWVGKKIGDYRVEQELGRGGMGVVYKAYHEKLRRDVAIKMILGGAGSHKDAKSRFETEARAVAALQHPGVVQLFEFGELDGNPYFALEYVDGGTLTERISESPLDSKDAAALVASLARTMQEAHDKQILHRDLKPSNILLTTGGSPKISDFGLAKQLIDNDQDTRTGTVMGTPSYMSPEQAKGETNKLTAGTDQYSLGAILYACLSGRPPFMSSSTIDTITQVVNKEPLPLRQLSTSIPADLETICLKTLQKAPDKRYESCQALADDLQRFLAGEPIHARPISRLSKAVRWCRRNPLIAIPSGLALASIIAIAGISTWAWSATAAQALVIQQEKENAEKATILAIEEKRHAEENLKIANEQATLALENIQTVITEIDPRLAERPGMNEMRLDLLRLLLDRIDKIDIERVGGLTGELTATQMSAQHKISMLLSVLNQRAKALEGFRELVKQARERIQLNGRKFETLSNLAKVLLQFASNSQNTKGNTEDTTGAYREALDLSNEIIAKRATDASFLQRLEAHAVRQAVSQNFATQELRNSKIQAAFDLHAAALQDAQLIVDMLESEEGQATVSEDIQAKQLLRFRSEITRSRDGIAYITLRLGDTAKAIELFDISVDERKAFLDQNAEDRNAKVALAGLEKLYGKSLLWVSKIEEAEPLLENSMELCGQLFQLEPENVRYKEGLAEAIYLLATVRDLQNHATEALSLFERSRLLRAEIYTAAPDQKNTIRLMLSEARVGNVNTALKFATQLGEQTEPDGELHLERARALAQLSRTADGDVAEKDFIAQSITAVERAIEEGFTEAFRFQAESDLAPLQELPEFQVLMTKLAQQTNEGDKARSLEPVTGER